MKPISYALGMQAGWSEVCNVFGLSDGTGRVNIEEIPYSKKKTEVTPERFRVCMLEWVK